MYGNGLIKYYIFGPEIQYKFNPEADEAAKDF